MIRIKRVQEGVGQHQRAQGISGEGSVVDFIDEPAAEQRVEQQIQHQDEPAAIRGSSARIAECLNDIAIRETDVHKFRNRKGYSVYDVGNQRRVPIRSHSVVELSSMYSIGILNLIARAVVYEVKVRRLESETLEGSKRYSSEMRAVGVQQIQRHSCDRCRNVGCPSYERVISHHREAK